MIFFSINKSVIILDRKVEQELYTTYKLLSNFQYICLLLYLVVIRLKEGEVYNISNLLIAKEQDFPITRYSTRETKSSHKTRGELRSVRIGPRSLHSIVPGTNRPRISHLPGSLKVHTDPPPYHRLLIGARY